jgi:hypothetical protein
MASIKYGCLHPDPETKIYPVASGQFFYHNGVNAVYLDGSGNVTLAITSTATLLGIAIVPKGRGSGTSDNYWKSSGTAGEDKIPVIPGIKGYSFLFPADDTATAGQRGDACDLISVNDGTATTVDIGTSSTDVFIIQDLATNIKNGAAATDIVVRLNLAKLQADT